jgi:hypothetical protein
VLETVFGARLDEAGRLEFIDALNQLPDAELVCAFAEIIAEVALISESLGVLQERLDVAMDVLADRVSPGLAREATRLYCGPDLPAGGGSRDA